MTLFSRLFEGRATTYQQVWGSDTDNEASPLAAPLPTRDKVLGLSAVFSCVRLLADTVSTLPVRAVESRGATTLEAEQQPGWIEQPIPRDPSTTIEVHFEQVVSAMLLDGNNFTLALPDIFRPDELRVLDPRQVEMGRKRDSSIVYKVRGPGGTVEEFDWTNIVHIPLIRLAGSLRGLSPLEAERQLFAGALATEELGATFAKNGLWLSAVIEAPDNASFTEAEADAMIRRIEAKYSGSRKAGKVGMLTGGATLRQLSVTPEQAQFLETRQYDDERIFRIYRCPPSLMGMTIEGAGSYALSANEAVAFEKHTIRPLVRKIQSAYRALVPATQQIRINTKGLLQGDPKAQAELYHYGLTDKWLEVDEVRGYEDMNPFGGTKGGLLETPNNNAPGGASAPVAA